MCVIAFSPKGTELPTKEQLTDMWLTNPDGAGYAYINRGKVVYRKGFMTLNALLEELEPNRERFKNTNFAVHFRIGTSGNNDKRTCHPFPISTNFSDLIKTEGEANAVLFHNGIIGDGGITAPTSSDTQDFVIAFAPLLRKHIKSNARLHFLNEATAGNRLLAMYGNGKYNMFGDWKLDGDIFVSNTNYQNHYTSYTYYNWGYTTPYNTDGDRLWEQVIHNQYKYITPSELRLLKETADDYTSQELVKDGYHLGYSEGDMLIWLEYNEEEYGKTNALSY